MRYLSITVEIADIGHDHDRVAYLRVTDPAKGLDAEVAVRSEFPTEGEFRAAVGDALVKIIDRADPQ